MQPDTTILIVDDEQLGRRVLRVLLSKQGYNLVFANNGSEALAMAHQLLPDLILLDIMMPDMDGFEVCQRIRESPLLAQVPIVMVTSLDDHESRLKGIEAGADDFITKPFNKTELRARIKTTTQLNRYRQLLAERARFAWMVQQTEDSYITLDNEDNILYANAQARLYLGLPPIENEKPSSKTFKEIACNQYHLEPQELWASWPNPISKNSASPRYLVRPETTTANALWLQVNIMKMDSGKADAYFVRLRDVSSSITMANSIWTFHAQISHKFKTPLTILTGFLELLNIELSNSTTEEIEYSLNVIRNSASQLQTQILDVFKYLETLDKNKPNNKLCSIDKIPAIIAETTTEMQFETEQISYDILVDATNVAIPLSKQTLKLIFWEIFNNSKRFHPHNKPSINVKVISISNGIRIQISDNGLNLAPNQLANMWIPYHQIEKHFTGQQLGMGLGLKVIASLVWNCGGTCHAYNSEDGPGIVIELDLPQHTS